MTRAEALAADPELAAELVALVDIAAELLTGGGGGRPVARIARALMAGARMRELLADLERIAQGEPRQSADPEGRILRVLQEYASAT